ncbi:hypothetical protein [Krasilnikovia sp. M28-CT-15]|uniref:hypothetical protein n=1 Tax=Krasilnikovia sp. M28-CT-15 TaxID=3373540 RepID=UPI0038774655
MSMPFRRARRSLAAVLLGTLAPVPVAATAHAATEYGKLSTRTVMVDLHGDEQAIATFTVHNEDTVPVQGFSISVSGLASPLKVDADFANCGQTPGDREDAHRYLVRCLFPVTLAPGTTYAFELPVRGADVFPDYSDDGDFTIDSWSDGDTQTWRKLEKETAPALALRPAAAPMPAAAFEDRGRSREYGGSTFRTSQLPSTRPDLAAVAESLTAHRGDVVHPQAGVRNDGHIAVINNPNFYHENDVEPLKPAFKITVPTGVTVVEANFDCHRLPDGSESASGPFANRKEFTCYGVGWESHPLKPTERYLPPFGLRLDQDVRDAVGTVTVLFDGDSNPANNTARYVINPTKPSSTSPAAPGATTAPTAPTAAAADTSGGGAGTGGLPITGPSLVGYLAAGAGIVLTGIALLVATRRRTPRAKG